MSNLNTINKILKKKKYTWLITGVAGFIGSNLLETLLKFNQKVIGVDNFLTGSRTNLNYVKKSVGRKQWKNFYFTEGDLCQYELCKKVCTKKVDYVLHQAALGSVPRSIKNPLDTHNNNVNSFLNMMIAAMNSRVKNFIYASSSSVYGDSKKIPKIEKIVGNQMSSYALSKYINELYSKVFFKNYGFRSIGLRYFNVFGKYQNATSSYAAVIPLWINQILKEKNIFINGDGKTTRDFCYVDNVVQANLLAALSNESEIQNEVFNIAVNSQVSLNQLYLSIKKIVNSLGKNYKLEPIYKNFRKGDIRHSRANISKAKKLIFYNPHYKFFDGLKLTVEWHQGVVFKNV
jgi:UDP-N-acetylglucosamine 4-epimerase